MNRQSVRTHFRRAGIVVSTMWSRGTGRFSLIVLGLWVLVSFVSLFWTPRSLWQTDGYNVWAKPSREHWLGTDGTGADVLSWLMAGSRTNLAIVVLTVCFALAFGLLLVSLMVSRSTLLANGTVVAIDALISIPTVLIALMLAVLLGASILGIVLACGFGYGLNLARVARPQAMLSARSLYVESALSNGASAARVFFTHVLTNIRPVVTVQCSLAAGTAVLAETGLTYLGVGVPSGVPSWGYSLASSVKFITIYPLTVVWPGLIVTVVVVALNLFGDALHDAADPLSNPRLRRGLMSVDLQSVNVSIAGRQIVRDVCLQIRDGQRVGLIGSSGSGKSMIARAIMGLLPQDAQLSGSINVNGTQTVGMNDVRLARPAVRRWAWCSRIRRLRSTRCCACVNRLSFRSSCTTICPRRTVSNVWRTWPRKWVCRPMCSTDSPPAFRRPTAACEHRDGADHVATPDHCRRADHRA